MGGRVGAGERAGRGEEEANSHVAAKHTARWWWWRWWWSRGVGRCSRRGIWGDLWCACIRAGEWEGLYG